MTSKNILWMVVLSFCFSFVAVAEDVKLALTNADEIRLRETPSKKGKYAGLLYKNMVVTILDKSKDKEKIDDKEDYWYQVKRAQQVGWCFGSFLTLDFDHKQQFDTYQTTKDLGWFFERYGSSTEYETKEFDANSFTTDEYRSMITASQKENEYNAPQILGLTLFKELKKDPKNPKLAYFKELFDSEDFWLKNINSALLANMPEKFSQDKAFLIKAENAHPKLGVTYLRIGPEALKKDADFVLKVLKDAGASGIYYASQNLKDDASFMRKAVKADKEVIFYTEQKIKDKLVKEMPELGKLIKEREAEQSEDGE